MEFSQSRSGLAIDRRAEEFASGRLWIVALIGAVGMASTALGQCEPTWQSPGEAVRGVGFTTAMGEVNELFEWDPDGAGPKASMLILAGNFDTAGSAACRNVAIFDGKSFAPLQGWVQGSVQALAEDQGKLLVGGSFSNVGGVAVSGLASWDGAAWSDIGGGVTLSENGNVLPGFVRDIVTWNGQIVVAGAFDKAGSTAVSHLAGWDGQAWSSIGGGVNTHARSLAVYQGDLYVSGGFESAGPLNVNSIARWNGKTWDSMQGGVTGNGWVGDIAVHDGLLYAAGPFSQMGGVDTGGLAAWNGSEWSSFAGSKAPSGAWSLQFQGDKPSIATGSSDGAFQWDGAKWAKLITSGQTWNVRSVGEFRGELVIGGIFYSLDGVGAASIARWDGSVWQAMSSDGFNNIVGTSFGREDGLYVGGTLLAAGDKVVDGVARWNGETWSAVGSGLLTPKASGDVATVLGLGEFRGDLHVTGSFQNVKIGQETINGIARWDGTNWRSLGLGLVYSAGPILEHEDSLYVGGTFGSAGGKLAARMARWDGSAWHALGDGVGGVGNPVVSDLVEFDGQVIAGGLFMLAGSKPANNIAAWNGSAWSPLGTGLAHHVTSVEVYKGSLYAGELSGPGTLGVSRWNGRTWDSISGPSLHIQSLGVHQGRLIAGGYFKSIGGVEASNLAQWDGVQWSPIAGGTNAIVSGITSWRNELVVNGSFTRAGDVPSMYLARWSCTCPADCDNSGSLNIDDFVCFQALFGLGESGTDCDGSGELDINDFVCFQTRFAVGC